MKKGAIISGICVLSGDVAIFEYENGIIKDSEHDLRLVRQALVGKEPKRLRSVLAEESRYESKFSKTVYIGANEIIERFTELQNKMSEKCFAHMATIISVDSDELAYGIGKRCLILCYDDETVYHSLLFIDVNESGDITRIFVDNDNRYHFKIDKTDCEN